MTSGLLRGALALLLSTLCIALPAQTCRNDIRATAPDSRYTDNGDGTVTDAATGLMWQQCPEGLWGAGCAMGAATTFIDWQDALEFAAAAELAGIWIGDSETARSWPLLWNIAAYGW